MTKRITVYSKPDCMQCDYTKKYLDDKGVEYTSIDVFEDEYAMTYVKDELGFTSMPVVEIEGMKPFGGFRPDKIAKAVQSWQK